MVSLQGDLERSQENNCVCKSSSHLLAENGHRIPYAVRWAKKY